MSEAKFKAAAVHAAPVYMNKQATLEKVGRLVKQAGQDGIKLLVFPETFVPGYPVSCPVRIKDRSNAKLRCTISLNVIHR